MEQLLEKILSKIKKTPDDTQGYEDLYYMCKEALKTDEALGVKYLKSLFTNKEELIGKLAEMYNEPILALVEEPEDAEGNVSWTASW